MSRITQSFVFCSLSLISLSALAASPTHIVVAPQCLIKKTGADYKTLATYHQLALIAANNKDIETLAEAKAHHNKSVCGGFMDVTREWNAYQYKSNKAISFLSNYAKPAKSLAAGKSYAIKYPTQVKQLLKNLNPQDMWSDLTTLTTFTDRYADSDHGVAAAMWFKSQVESMAANSGHTDVTTYTIATGDYYKQPSVVVKIGNSNEPGIVIGGHMDTLMARETPKPGADDDGSGSVTVLETARLLLNSGMTFKKPIYLIWYSAEEEGLVGSDFVVSDFVEKGIKVDAALQLDMTGYAYQNDPTMWLFEDYVDTNLTAYLEKLITTYVKQPVKYSACGYACSDHATWNHYGFASAFPFEASMGTDNPDIHTSRDTMDKLSLEHMTSFAMLAAAFAVELAEPVAK